jgi:mono/diheme cytochrome c family protein
VTYNAQMIVRPGTRALIVAAAALAAAVAWSPIGPRAAGQDDELPDGAGKKVLLRACTTCHDLDEVTKFKGYYTRAQWKDIVVTMREYGATLDAAEVEALSEYLFAALGKKQ